MKTYQLTIRHFLNDDDGCSKKWPGTFHVQVNVIYSGQRNRIGSQMKKGRITYEEFDKWICTAEPEKEESMLRDIIQYETDNLTKKFSNFKGFASRYKGYLTHVLKAYELYGVGMITMPLIHGEPLEYEKEIIERINAFYPFEKLYDRNNDFRTNAIENPHSLIKNIHSQTKELHMTSEDSIVRDLNETFDCYFEGHKYLSYYVDSLPDGAMPNLYDWHFGDLQQRFHQYLKMAFPKLQGHIFVIMELALMQTPAHIKSRIVRSKGKQATEGHWVELIA